MQIEANRTIIQHAFHYGRVPDADWIRIRCLTEWTRRQDYLWMAYRDKDAFRCPG